MNPDKRIRIRLAAMALVVVGLMGLGACTERMDIMVGPFDEQKPSDSGEPANDASLDAKSGVPEDAKSGAPEDADSGAHEDADSGAPEDAVADTEVVDVTEDVMEDVSEGGSGGIASGRRCRPGEEPRGGCEEGLVCLSDEYGGVCAKPCESYAQCDNGGRCLSLSNGGSTPPSTNFCTHQCEPWDPEACGDQAGCSVVSSNGVSDPGLWQCTARDGTLGSGKTCSEDKQCKPGWICERDSETCRKPCRVNKGNADCSADDSGFVYCTFWRILYFAGNEISFCSQ